MMDQFNQLRAWWIRATWPGPVEPELAWRGHLLNTLLLGLMIFAAPFVLINVVFWLVGLDSGGAILSSLAFSLVYSLLFWFSKKRSVRVAILSFGVSNVILSFLLSLGWGVADITSSAIYAASIIENSILLRGRAYFLTMGSLLVGYTLLGWAELAGWFKPPFFTELSANYLTMILFLIFLSFLGAVTAVLIDRVLTAQTAEVGRRQELESRTQIAAEVQLSMLPSQPPVHRHFDLAGQSIPARDVGGDFYSYYTLGNGHLAIVVGDVTGKGIPAALLMAVTIGMIDGLVPNFTEPVELMTAVSTRLYKHSQRSRLNAACLLTFLEGNRLRVVNAGCIEPVIRRANGQVEWLNIGGLPMGLEPTLADGQRHLAERELSPGDMAIFVTDGVVECKNERGHLLGFDGLEAIVAAGPNRSAQEMKSHILEQVDTFRGQHEPEDDMTVVVAQLKELPTHAA